MLALGLVAAAGYYGPELLTRSEFLRVEHVVIKGNRHMSSGEVLALLDRLPGENILEVDLGRLPGAAAAVGLGAGGHVAAAVAGND